jgi:hypothetical protein
MTTDAERDPFADDDFVDDGALSQMMDAVENKAGKRPLSPATTEDDEDDDDDEDVFSGVTLELMVASSSFMPYKHPPLVE